MEDLPQFKDLLTKYERFKGSLVDSSKKDINTIKSFPELSQLQVKVGNDTVDLGAYRGKKVKKEVGADAKTNFNFPGSEILKVGTDYTLIRISDKGDLGSKAASYFGGYSGGLDRGESNWCTAAEGSSHSHGYRQNGPLYIFMANDDKGQVGQVTGLPTERYQIHFPSNQFKSRDQYSAGGNVPIVEWLNGKWGEFKELLKPEFAAGFVKQNIGGGGDKVDIKYPDSATGKFIALYGFDELFNVLPDSIVELNVINTSNEPINLTIPESISRFKNIKSILFDNVISELPDSICELKNLYFLALPNNKNLKSIPDCVMTSFPNLVIINLVGSNPNVKIPEKMKDHFFENMMYYFEE
jgi:hypothetical protein